MNVVDAGRGVLVAHARVREALERGAKREAEPADLAVALVALDSAVAILRRSLDARCAHADRCECGHTRAEHRIVGPFHEDDLEHFHCEGCGSCREFRMAYAST